MQEMSAVTFPTRRQRPSAKQMSRVNFAQFTNLPSGDPLKSTRLQAPAPQSKNGDTVFDPEAFLAKAGVGKKIVTLKKGQSAYAQGEIRVHNSLLNIFLHE